MQALKIEMINDVVCSWCHIGYHNISQALDNLSDEILPEFHYLPFQLNPNLGPEGVDITEHLCERYGWSLEKASAYRESLLATTRQLGVVIDFNKRTRYYNTEKAHRLILSAQTAGLQRQMHQALLNAYHVDGENISDADVLVNIAEKAGLDHALIQQALGTEAFRQPMQTASQRVQQYRVKSVPAFIFNETRFVSGSNSVEFFESLIRREFLNKDGNA